MKNAHRKDGWYWHISNRSIAVIFFQKYSAMSICKKITYYTSGYKSKKQTMLFYDKKCFQTNIMAMQFSFFYFDKALQRLHHTIWRLLLLFAEGKAFLVKKWQKKAVQKMALCSCIWIQTGQKAMVWQKNKNNSLCLYWQCLKKIHKTSCLLEWKPPLADAEI